MGRGLSGLDDPKWAPGQAPNEIGRQRFGRVSIANSDAAASAETGSAAMMGMGGRGTECIVRLNAARRAGKETSMNGDPDLVMGALDRRATLGLLPRAVALGAGMGLLSQMLTTAATAAAPRAGDTISRIRKKMRKLAISYRP